MSQYRPDRGEPEGFDRNDYRVGGWNRPSNSGSDRKYNHESGTVKSTLVEGRKNEFLAYLVQGYSIKEAGRAMGVAYSTARGWAKDPKVLAELLNLSKTVYHKVYGEVVERKVEAHQRILELADEALSELEELVHSENEMVKMRAIDSVLDRHGMVPRATKNTSIQTTVHVDVETLMAAAAAAREIESVRAVPKGMIEADKPTQGE